MTLPARLAREALPCQCGARASHGYEDLHEDECDARVYPAVEAAIRKAIEACAATRCYPCKHVGSPTLMPGRGGLWHCTPNGEPVAHCDAYSIRALLTDEETP